MHGWLMVIVVVLAAGCAKSSPQVPSHAGSPSNSPAKGVPRAEELGELYESVRTGLVLVDSAVEGVEELHAMTTELQPKLKGEASNVAGLVREAVDSAGALLSEIETDLPERSAYEKDFAVWDERRLSAITACNDALHELGEAGEGLTTIGDLDTKLRPEVDDILLALRLAEEDLSAGVVKLGGTVEPQE